MVEFQIPTEEMHHICEDGITAHCFTATATRPTSCSAIRGLAQRVAGNSKAERNILGIHGENIKVDIFPDRVYVFSPRGRIIQLPKGSTAVDFAYQIHTDLGNCTIGCEINGETAPLTRELKNGRND